MTFRIQTLTNNKRVTFALSGQVDSIGSAELKRLFDEHANGHQFILDLGDVELIERSAVSYLAVCERNGIELRNCPNYVRDWITRESENNKNNKGDRS